MARGFLTQNWVNVRLKIVKLLCKLIEFTLWYCY